MSHRDIEPRRRTSGGRAPAAVGVWKALGLPGLVIALLACTTSVKLETVNLEQSDQLLQVSERSLQALRLLQLSERYEADPLQTLLSLDRHPLRDRRPDLLYAVAELAFREGYLNEEQTPDGAAAWYLTAAARAYTFLFDRPVSPTEQAFDPRFNELRELYGRAVGRFLDLAQERGRCPGDEQEITTATETFSFRVERGEGLWEPEYFDEIIPVGGRTVRGLRNRYRTPGLGATLVAVRQNRQQLPIEKYYPAEGIIRPATAIIHFQAPRSLSRRSAFVASREAVLSLHDPMQHDHVEVRGQHVPLAADYTAPLGHQAEVARVRELGRKGLRDADSVQLEPGIFLMQPYDPEKIPVLMIHGLRSSPLVWIEMTNDLLGSPRLRERYQVWHYLYPSSLPYLYSGSLLRQSLDDLFHFLDPAGESEALRSMVIVAHSMGGLLARTLVTDSGDALWKTAFQVPPERLVGLPGDVERVREAFYTRHEPYVSRVVFIATPHRGSRLASSLAGRLGASLVRLPSYFLDLVDRVFRANSEILQPAMRTALLESEPNSIRTLTPGHPMLLTLANLPIPPEVAAHSIIGDRGQAQAQERSDGIVPYESAHLPGAVSELVVPSGHNAYAHPKTIGEVRRILRLHLTGLDGIYHEDDTGDEEEPAGIVAP